MKCSFLFLPTRHFMVWKNLFEIAAWCKLKFAEVETLYVLGTSLNHSPAATPAPTPGLDLHQRSYSSLVSCVSAWT